MDGLGESSPEHSEELEERRILDQLSDHIKGDYVKKRYLTQKRMHTLQSDSKNFIDVQLVKYPIPCEEKGVFDIAVIMREGLAHIKDMPPSSSELQGINSNSSFTRITNIFEMLKPIRSNERCKSEVILIDGAPGMGKTTLCKEIAYRWAKNQSLVDLKLVFFISLQSVNLEKIKTMEDFILHFYDFDKSAAKFANQCVDILHKRDNHDVLFILDGYEICRTEDSFLSCIIGHKLFNQSKIIITPQGVATSTLQDIASVRVEILGFSDESKKEYIKKEFQNSPNKIDLLSSYLDANKNINSICYVPLIMNIFVQLCKETEKLPESQTDIYQKLICFVIFYNAQMHNKCSSLQSVSLLFQELPKSYKNHLIDLSKVAFNCLKDGKILFTNTDLGFPNTEFPLNFLGLGLLKLTCFDDCVSYNFLHSSMQEFLAACYIYSQEPCIQFELLRSTFFLEEYTNSWITFESLNDQTFLEILDYSVYCKSCLTAKRAVQEIRSLDVVENFVKLTKDSVKNVHAETLQMLCIKFLETKFYNTQCLRNTTDEHSIMNKIGVNRFSWNKIYLSIYYHDDKMERELIESFVIDRNMQENAYSRIASELNVNKDLAVLIVNSSSLLAYTANSQQIAYGFNVINKWLASLVMRNCVLTDETCALMSSYIKTCKLKLVSIVGCKFSNSLDKILTSLSQIVSLEMIFLGDITITEDMAALMASVITSNNKIYILDFTNCDFQHRAALNVAAALKNISTLQTLIFDNCNLTKDVADDLAVALYVNQNLKRIRLPNNNLQDGVNSIASALCQMKTLTELNLKNNSLSEVVIDEISSAIKSNTLIETLNLSTNNFKTSGIIKIAQPLSVISNLKILNLQSNQITEGAADAIAIAILSNPKLEELYLGSNNLTTGVTKIATALQYLTTLKLLDINNNNAPEEAAKELAVAVYNNRLELENLWLANNKFGSCVSLIADSLTKTNTLIGINLSGNCIPEEVASDIAAVIDSNHSLQDIRLSDNLLMTDGIIKIAQSLSKLSTLRILQICDNKVDDRAADALAAVIVNNTNLDDLFLNDNLFQTGSVTIANAVKNISNLTRLEFNSNGLPNCVAEELAAAIVSNSGLNSIGIMNNGFEGSGMIAITQAMKSLKHLTFVNIYNSPLTEEAIESLSFMISCNKDLKDFYLGKNKCHQNVKGVINILKNASKLRKLSLQDSDLSERVAEDLATALANKPLERLEFDNNSLKASGIAIITKLLNKMSTLKILSFHNNHITEEGADGIASIIISNCGLTDLYLGKNKLKIGALKVAKALKHISKLRLLDFNDNSIPTVVADELAAAILCNNHLEHLRLRCNAFKTKGIQVIAKSLSRISTLKLLNLRSNYITEVAVDDIIAVLESNQEIEHLYLGNNFLQSGVSKIAVAMKKCSSLKTLDFDNNNVSGNACNEIASVISDHHLEALYLQHNQNLSGMVIAQALSVNSTFTCIDLNDNNLTGMLADQFASAFLKFNSLEDLRFRNNSFKAKEMVGFLQSLCNLSSLKSINFGGNRLTKEIAELLSLIVMNNPTIKELYLGNNNLQAGILEMVIALKRSSASCLKLLDVSNNSVPETVIVEFADFINTSKLEKLYLSCNNLHSSSDVILNSLSKINTLKELYLDGCNLTETASYKLGIALINNYSLQELQLKNNHFKSTGIIMIAESLSKSSTLKLFNIRNNHITEEAADIIASMILNNSVLEQVYLGDNEMGKATGKILISLKSIATLVHLNLSNMSMTDEVANELAAVVISNPLLESLYLDGNKLLSTGLSVITETCRRYSKNLKVLDIRCNLVDPATMDNFLFNIGNIHSLEALYAGTLTTGNICEGITLNQSHLIKCDAHENISQSTLDVACLAVQNLNFSNLVRYNYDATFTLSFNYAYQSFYDMFREEFVSKTRNLERKKKELSKMNAKNVITFLPIIKSLSALDLECNNIDEEAAFELAAALRCNNVLSQLWLKDNELGATGALFILNSLQHISSLKVLDLSNNNIGYQIADSIAAVIDCNHSLEQLWLDGNAFLSKGVVRFTQSLKHLSTLRVLSLCNNGIGDDAADELCAVIESNVHLEDVMLSSNDFNSEGICKIIQTLNILFRLRKLDLFNNKITKHAASTLANSISNCYSLQELYLSDNMLETTGTITILQALKFKSKLQVLTLSNNGITEQAVNDLTDVLVNNNMFYILLIGENNLQTAAVLKIARTVKKFNSGMRVLNLCDNDVNEQGKHEVTKTFSSISYLQLYV